MTFADSFSRDFAAARGQRGLTQLQAAEALDVSYRLVQQIEQEAHIPRTEYSLRICFLWELDVSRYREAILNHVPVHPG